MAWSDRNDVSTSQYLDFIILPNTQSFFVDISKTPECKRNFQLFENTFQVLNETVSIP